MQLETISNKKAKNPLLSYLHYACEAVTETVFEKIRFCSLAEDQFGVTAWAKPISQLN